MREREGGREKVWEYIISKNRSLVGKNEKMMIQTFIAIKLLLTNGQVLYHHRRNIINFFWLIIQYKIVFMMYNRIDSIAIDIWKQ